MNLPEPVTQLKKANKLNYYAAARRQVDEDKALDEGRGEAWLRGWQEAWGFEVDAQANAYVAANVDAYAYSETNADADLYAYADADANADDLDDADADAYAYVAAYERI